MFPPEDAEEHETCVSAVEVVASDSVGDGEGREPGSIPADAGRVRKPLNVLLKA